MSKGHDKPIVLRKARLGYYGDAARKPVHPADKYDGRKLFGAPEIVRSNPGAPIMHCVFFYAARATTGSIAKRLC